MFSINDALTSSYSNPPRRRRSFGKRRATESELRQTQSTLLPQVRIEASYGPEKFDQNRNGSPPVIGLTPGVVGAGPWRNGSRESVVVRQLLFDGFASIHDVWRQTARVNAAASRVKERSELLALDAAEAYVDVVRYMRLVGLAEQNVANHEKIFANVNSRFSGGRAGEGDFEQSRERVENARRSTRGISSEVSMMLGQSIARSLAWRRSTSASRDLSGHAEQPRRSIGGCLAVQFDDCGGSI